MFTSTGSNGFYKAPLSKSLLLVPSAISILLTLLFQHYQKFFAYNLQAVKEDFQIWRLVCGRTICLDLKDTFCSSLLIYNFRVFERRYGSRKFSSFLLGTWMLSALFDLLLVEITQYVFGITINSLPSGFLGPVFALFVPFYSSIPRVQVTQVLGHFSITNKSLVYILGLQLLTSGSYIWILALSGLISGICYNNSILKVHRILCVPRWVAKIFSWTLEPVFSSAEPMNEVRVGMGATVDIQRQQRMELLDRQIMMSQVAQMRRQRQQQLPIIFTEARLSSDSCHMVPHMYISSSSYLRFCCLQRLDFSYNKGTSSNCSFIRCLSPGTLERCSVGRHRSVFIVMGSLIS